MRLLWATLFLLTFLVPVLAFGAAPPWWVPTWQAGADEQLRIQMLRLDETVVAEEDSFLVYHGDAHARVLQVYRTSSDVQVGDLITVKFAREELKPGARIFGPNPMHPLRGDGKYLAYLARTSAGHLVGAAREGSFTLHAEPRAGGQSRGDVEPAIIPTTHIKALDGFSNLDEESLNRMVRETRRRLGWCYRTNFRKGGSWRGQALLQAEGGIGTTTPALEWLRGTRGVGWMADACAGRREEAPQFKGRLLIAFTDPFVEPDWLDESDLPPLVFRPACRLVTAWAFSC